MKKNLVFSSTATLTAVLGLGAMLVVGAANAGEKPKTLHSDAVTLIQAVETAKKTADGIVIEAERDVVMSQAVYEIEIISDTGEEINTVVSAATGEVILTNTHRNHDNDVEDAIWLAGIRNGTFLSLEQALMQAEAQVDGKAWRVEQDDHLDRPYYEVDLLNTSGNHVEIKIDARVLK
ncbi:PepSY domain-containing protein [Salinivibrio costicola]|uniref:PepSY domain-containing protein n=1 Tax=Salinivibrio costicola TaxID=51367 RepID=UPI003F6F79AF